MWRGVADQAIAITTATLNQLPLSATPGRRCGREICRTSRRRLVIRVSLLVAYDPTRFADNLSPNVERYINLYQSLDISGGRRRRRRAGPSASTATMPASTSKTSTELSHQYGKVLETSTTNQSARLLRLQRHLRVRRVKRAAAHRHSINCRSGLWTAACHTRAGDTLPTLAATYPCAALGAEPGQQLVARAQR